MISVDLVHTYLPFQRLFNILLCIVCEFICKDTIIDCLIIECITFRFFIHTIIEIFYVRNITDVS